MTAMSTFITRACTIERATTHDVSRPCRLTTSRGGSLMSRATSRQTADTLEYRVFTVKRPG
jgi:hypothetical protein